MAHAVTQQLARLSVGSNDSVKAYSGFRAVNARIIPQVVSRSPASGRRGTLQIMNARVGGVEIPNAKPIEYSLQYIFGIGHTTAKAICVDTGIDGTIRTRDLTEDDLTKLREEVDKYTIEGDLRRYVNLNIKRLKEIQCYRGKRHIMGLPVRGQGTKNNARTRKGRAVAIPGKKK